MKKSMFFSIIVIVLLIPATLYLGTKMTGRAYYFISTLVIIETMLPFFVSFEKRRPQARELVTIAVMCALSVAARVVVQIPNFKPMLGIIMITGIAFGAEAGFMTGSVGAFASNFFFSQGPWTPWQMMAYGIGGFIAGMIFHKRELFTKKPWRDAVILGVFGFFGIALVVGPLLDCCTLFTTGTRITGKYVLAVFASGFPYNLQHGLSTGITMLLLAKPLLFKLRRIQIKYGMMEAAK